MSRETTAAIAEEFQMLPLASVRPPSYNVRRRFDPKLLEEMARTMRAHGVLEPLLVRPVHNGYEVVAGERRRRAAALANLELAPCRILGLTDQQAREMQVIENLQREDPSALEEGLGYRSLLDLPDTDGAAGPALYTVEGIAARIGKSPSYVYQRLKLCEMVAPAQKALDEGKISASHALLIARLQPADQLKALAALQELEAEDGGLSVRGLEEWIHTELFQDLARAPWPKDDAMLLPEAGPCTTCPKRAANIPGLYAEDKRGGKPDLCTDPICYEGKFQAHIEWRLEQLAVRDVRKVLEVSTLPSWERQQERGKTPGLGPDHWRKVGKKACEHARPAIVVSGNGRGELLEVCAEPKCKTHAAGRGSTGNADIDRYQGQERARRKREAKTQKYEIAWRRRVVEAILAKITLPLPRAELMLLAGTFWDRLWHDVRKALLPLLGLEPRKQQYGEDLNGPVQAALPKYSDRELARFLVLAAFGADLWAGSGHRPKALLEAAARWKVKVAGIQRAVRAEQQQKPARARKLHTSPKPRGGRAAKAAGRTR